MQNFWYIKLIESIKHLLGLCGEPHGLLHVLVTFSGLSVIIAYLKNIKQKG